MRSLHALAVKRRTRSARHQRHVECTEALVEAVMAKVLVVFESDYGQTAKIAEHIGALTRRLGHEASVLRVGSAREVELDAYGAIVVCAPVYFGKHPRATARFIEDRSSRLAERPCAFVSVSGAAGNKDPVAREEAFHRAQTFVRDEGFHPRTVISTAGAYAYPRYGFFLRAMMKLIAQRKGDPTDTSKIHEATDWAALDIAIADFVERNVEPSVLEHSGVFNRPVHAAS
jgi:menaquinone-dependent protoporphyrinogen oxidase